MGEGTFRNAGGPRGASNRLCLREDKPRCREPWEGGDRLFGNQQIPASSKPVVTSVSPLAQSRGGAGEVSTSLQEHWRARASPAVQTTLGIGLSVVGGNGPWNLLSGSPSAGKTGFKSLTLCL